MKKILVLLIFSVNLVCLSQNKANSPVSNTKSSPVKVKVGLLNYFNTPEIPISVFDATDSLTAYLESNGIKKRLEVIKGEITFNNNGITKFTKLTANGKIKKEDLETLKKLPIGTVIFIDNILLKYPDESIRTASPIKFKLSKWQVLTD